MAAIKISTLTAKTVPVAADSFVIVDSAAADNKKVSYSDLRSTILDAETTINESGADVDFRVESDTKTHAIFVQGSDGFVGINKAAPTRQLDVVGNTSLDGAVIINEGAIDVDFEVRGDSQTNALFVQGSNGNVGIFTGTPATELEVNGNIGFTSDGQGIDFGNSSGGVSGSSTSTLLDDYEEGTWTPEFFSGFSAGAYGTRYGRYTKIGNQVFLHWRIALSSGTGNGDDIAITGLPFAPTTGVNGVITVGNILGFDTTFTGSVSGEIEAGSSRIALYRTSENDGSGQYDFLTDADTTTSFTIFGSATYITDS